MSKITINVAAVLTNEIHAFEVTAQIEGIKKDPKQIHVLFMSPIHYSPSIDRVTFRDPSNEQLHPITTTYDPRSILKRLILALPRIRWSDKHLSQLCVIQNAKSEYLQRFQDDRTTLAVENYLNDSIHVIIRDAEASLTLDEQDIRFAEDFDRVVQVIIEQAEAENTRKIAIS